MLFRTMLSYTGFYRFEEDKFITTVDVSWNELWAGTDQVRSYTLDGDRLDIMTAWMQTQYIRSGLGVESFLGNVPNDRLQVVRCSQS